MLKIGLVGTGFMAKTHAEAYGSIAGVEIAGFTARDAQRGADMAAQFGGEYFADYSAMLARPDIAIIDICAPTHLHEEFVVRAAEAGKHIICEKPFALTLEAVDRMLAAVDRAGVKFMIAQVLRFWPEYMKIKALYDSGELGLPNVVYANRLAQHPTWGEWFGNVEQSGGGLFDLHLHDIDYLHYLFGPVKHLYASGKKFANGAWNHVVTNLTFENGVKAVVEGCFSLPAGYPFTMTLRAVGDQSAVEYVCSAGVNLEDLGSAKNNLMLFKQGAVTQLQVPQDNPYANELRYFVDCVTQNKQPDIAPPQDSREVLRLVLAIQASLETGEIQHLRKD